MGGRPAGWVSAHAGGREVVAAQRVQLLELAVVEVDELRSEPEAKAGWEEGALKVFLRVAIRGSAGESGELVITSLVFVDRLACGAWSGVFEC